MSQETILFEKAMKNVNSILKVTGLQLIADNNDENVLVRLRRRWLFCFIFVWFNTDVLAEVAWFVDGALNGKGLLELTYPAPCIAHCVLANVKAYYFIQNEPYINDLVSTLGRLQNITLEKKIEKIETEIMKRMSFLTKATNIQFWLNVVSLGGFAVLPFVIMTLTYLETGKVLLVMPFVVLYPFDVYDFPLWPFFYVREMYSATIIVFLVLGKDCLYYACCTYIQIEFFTLNYDLGKIVSENGDHLQNTNVSREIAACVERHQELIRCVSLMERIYSKSTLLNVVTSSMLICLTGFNVTANQWWPMVMPFVAFVFLVSGQIFLLCYYGDQVMQSSTSISDAIYNCQWYNTRGGMTKDLLFILTRAQKPCTLTAFGFSNINLSSFTRILSTAWSYFALLTSVNRRNNEFDVNLN